MRRLYQSYAFAHCTWVRYQPTPGLFAIRCFLPFLVSTAHLDACATRLLHIRLRSPWWLSTAVECPYPMARFRSLHYLPHCVPTRQRWVQQCLIAERSLSGYRGFFFTSLRLGVCFFSVTTLSGSSVFTLITLRGLGLARPSYPPPRARHGGNSHSNGGRVHTS
jgi:hypothetical protein